MAKPPDMSPVMAVSATHEAREAATAASAADPPSARISAPTSAVAGCPAAIAAPIDAILMGATVGAAHEARSPCAFCCALRIALDVRGTAPCGQAATPGRARPANDRRHQSL